MVLIPVGLWSCSATKNANGSITITFSPELTITAWGLEDALQQLIGMLENCLEGNYPHPCTSEQMAEIDRTIESIVKRKNAASFVSG